MCRCVGVPGLTVSLAHLGLCTLQHHRRQPASRSKNCRSVHNLCAARGAASDPSAPAAAGLGDSSSSSIHACPAATASTCRPARPPAACWGGTPPHIHARHCVQPRSGASTRAAAPCPPPARLAALLDERCGGAQRQQRDGAGLRAADLGAAGRRRPRRLAHLQQQRPAQPVGGQPQRGPRGASPHVHALPGARCS